MDLNIGRRPGLKFGVWAALFVAGCSLSPPRDVVLRQDAQNALAEAALAHQPVLLVYGAPWCSACRALLEGLQHKQVARALAGVQVVQVEVGENLQSTGPLPKQWQPEAVGLQSVPLLVYVSAQEPTRPASMLQGYVGPKRLVEWLKSTVVGPATGSAPAS